jgi:hypothetical protein
VIALAERPDGHERPVRQAEAAMRQSGRRPELAVLRALPDDHLRNIIARHSGPFYVA